MKGTRVIVTFADRALSYLGSVYFDVATAKEVVGCCEKQDCAVLAMEGFLIENETITALADAMADFSDAVELQWEQRKEVCNQAALKLLEEWEKCPSNFKVELDVVSNEEWSERLEQVRHANLKIEDLSGE